MKKTSLGLFILIAALAAAAPAQEAKSAVAGVWEVAFETPMGARTYMAVLVQDQDALKVTMKSAQGTEMKAKARSRTRTSPGASSSTGPWARSSWPSKASSTARPWPDGDHGRRRRSRLQGQAHLQVKRTAGTACRLRRSLFDLSGDSGDPGQNTSVFPGEENALRCSSLALLPYI